MKKRRQTNKKICDWILKAVSETLQNMISQREAEVTLAQLVVGRTPILHPWAQT